MPDLSTDHSSATLEGAHSHGARRAYVSSRADRPTSFDPADIPVSTKIGRASCRERV